MAILTLAAICSCTEEIKPQVSETDSHAPIFTALTPSDETKTSLDGELNVLWNAGDELSIFCGSTANSHYRLASGAGKTSATFEKVSSSDFEAGTEQSNNIAWYPYDNEASIRLSGTAYVVDINLPSIQNYAQNSFGLGANAMVAITEDVDDHNLCFNMLKTLSLSNYVFPA